MMNKKIKSLFILCFLCSLLGINISHAESTSLLVGIWKRETAFLDCTQWKDTVIAYEKCLKINQEHAADTYEFTADEMIILFNNAAERIKYKIIHATDSEIEIYVPEREAQVTFHLINGKLCMDSLKGKQICHMRIVAP